MTTPTLRKQMRELHAALNWVRQLFRSRTFEREMQAEMQAHIEQEAALNRARGMAERDAIAAAKRDFGNVAYLQEQSRDARGTRFVEETKRDIIYGLRSLVRTPGFTTVALLSLALGIGVNTGMVTFFRFIFAPVQVSQPDTYVAYGRGLTYPGWQAIANERGLFEKTVVHSSMSVALSRDGATSVKATADLVSDGYFSMYNGRAHIGRLLVPGESSDASASPAAVVSYPFWRRELSGDSSVIGRTLRLTNGLQLTVVGVANERFSGASSGLGAQPADFWLPLVVRNRMPTFQRGDQQSISPFTDANAEWLSMSAQLPEGVLLEQATLHLRNLLTHLPTADSANVNDLTSPLLTQGRRGFINRNNALSISFALSATAMVLLIGCANVANLVLARGVRRRREIAVRLSLGASRVRLIRQLMTESAMLGLAGGLAAIIVSQVILKILSASEILVFLKVDAETLARGLKPDAYVIVFTFIMAFVSATASGLVPSLRSTKMNLSRATRDDGAAIGTRRSRSRLRTGLVIGQVALSLALLNTATALLRSSANANESDVGFDYQKVVTIAALRSGNGYSNARFLNYLHELQERTTQLVGPENVARGTILLTGSGGMNFARVSPSEPGLRSTPLALASANYFTVLGLPIVRGRAFTELEARNSAPVVIISESTAKQYWPTTDALGQRLKLADEQWSESTGRRVLQNERDVMVVGVAHDAQTVIVGSARNPMMYAPADSGSVLVRASENPATLARTLRELARVTDRDMIANVRTQDEVMHSIVHSADITSKYTGVLGTFGLLLSAIGIFGVVTYTVSQRTHEIGIRLAIGAQPFDVMRLMLVQGMRPVLLGIAMGVAATAMVSRGLLAGFSGISPFDPVAYLTAAAIVASVALVACYVPSRRATTIDPVGAIRSE